MMLLFEYDFLPIDFIWIAISSVLTVIYLINSLPLPESLVRHSKFLMLYGKSLENIGLTAKDVSRSMFHVPKRYFLHFYICSVVFGSLHFISIFNIWINNSPMFTWTLILSDAFGCASKDDSSKQPVDGTLSLWLAMALYLLHVTRRLYECLFISTSSSTAYMNVAHYAWGILYYILIAITLPCGSRVNNVALGNVTWSDVIGSLVWLAGVHIQHDSLKILAKLRTDNKKKSDEPASQCNYIMPTSGWFKLVSSPHYFGELLIYLGLLIIIHHHNTSWYLVMGYNIVTHVNMAVPVHQWYAKKYPAQFNKMKRKALIPFIL